MYFFKNYSDEGSGYGSDNNSYGSDYDGEKNAIDFKGGFLTDKFITSEITATYDNFPAFVNKYVEKIIDGPDSKLDKKIYEIYKRLDEMDDKTYDRAMTFHNKKVGERRKEISAECMKKEDENIEYIKKDAAPVERNIFTKAFIKLYECYTYLRDIHGFTPEAAFFIAELPGASIIAYRYVYNNFNWYAQSAYRGYYEEGKQFLVDDNFKLLKNYPEKWIGYKEGLSGNILDKQVVDKTINGFLSKNITKKKLISCDGGTDSYKFDSFNSYIKRFDSMHILMRQEWYIAEKLIKPGDCFILKVYNTLTNTNILNLLTEISTNFKETIIYKPLGGNILNDEVYLLYVNYKDATSQQQSQDKIAENRKFCEMQESIKVELRYVLTHQLQCLVYIINLILSGFRSGVDSTDKIIKKR